MISFAILLLAACVILLVEGASNALIIILAILAGILAFVPTGYAVRRQ